MSIAAPSQVRGTPSSDVPADCVEENDPATSVGGPAPRAAYELPTATRVKIAAAPGSLDGATSHTRRDLNAMLGDGAAYSVMVGIGENYLPAFALAMGMGQVVAGLIACVPLLAGAILQLVSPYGVRRLGSYRRWVSLCAAVQAASFLPLIAAACRGSVAAPLLFLIAGVYWGAGMSAGPAWSAWATSIVPTRVRSRFFACRTRISQAGVLVGFVGGGVALQYGSSLGRPLDAFAAVFVVAAVCRFISSRLLASQSEPLWSRPVAAGQILDRRELLTRLRHRGEGKLLWYLWGIYAMAQIAGPYFTPFILGQLQYGYATYMLILATSIFAKTVSMPLWGRFAHRYGSRRLMTVGGLLMVPLPLMWLFSQAVPYLLCIQLFAGFSWAAFELAIILMSFDCISASHRTSILTVYNLGYAVASVGGSLIGGLLLKLGNETFSAYLVVFAVSAVGRLLTVPLLRLLPHKIEEPARNGGAVRVQRASADLAAAFKGTSRPPTAQPAVAP